MRKLFATLVEKENGGHIKKAGTSNMPIFIAGSPSAAVFTDPFREVTAVSIVALLFLKGLRKK